MNVKNIFLLFGWFFGVSCGNVNRVDTQEVKKIMVRSKIQKVTEAQFTQIGNELGGSISKEFNYDLNLECQDTYIFKNQKIELYDIEAQDYIKNIKNPKQSELLEAYDFGLKNGQNPGQNIQKIDDSTYVFTFVLDKSTKFFSKCGKEVGLIVLPKKILMEEIYNK